MSFTLLTGPAVEPITLQEAKDHLRVDDEYEDALIAGLIETARDHVEAIIRRPLVTQTWLANFDMFDCAMELKANLQSIVSVKYVDQDGIQQTLPASEYDSDSAGYIGTIYPAYDKSWPDTRNQKNAVEIEFIAGYGVAADVPGSITAAMKLLIGHWFVNREAVIVGVSVTECPAAVDMLLTPYRVISF